MYFLGSMSKINDLFFSLSLPCCHWDVCGIVVVCFFEGRFSSFDRYIGKCQFFYLLQWFTISFACIHILLFFSSFSSSNITQKIEWIFQSSMEGGEEEEEIASPSIYCIFLLSLNETKKGNLDWCLIVINTACCHLIE